ncbi:MAG TPA: hypothetical protein DCZ13_07145 [Porticoccaceae bacterium]|nr:hypothetical protein [Porticoccaceae bacterium]
MQLIDNRTRLAVSIMALLASLLTGCLGAGFKMQNLAKSEVDFFADAHYEATQELLRELTGKLYRRNPAELAKSPGATLETRLEQLFGRPGALVFDELAQVRTADAMQLALDPQFQGDRVFALMAGLNGMIRSAYEYRAEFYMPDALSEDKLYRSARNVEILVWRLSRVDPGEATPLLLTNSRPGEQENLSFERLFGKLISIQDMMAEVASQRNDRLISRVVQNVASMVFLPL